MIPDLPPLLVRESGVLLGISSTYLASHSNSIQARIGISWRSSLDACNFAESEIPDGKWGTDEGFEHVRSAAKSKWDDVLGTVEVGEEGVKADTLTTFWTSVSGTNNDESYSTNS